MLKHIELISEKTISGLKNPKSPFKFLINWKTGVLISHLECQISGLLDGIVSIIHKLNCVDEFIVEIIGNTKGNKGIASSFEWETPFRSVIIFLIVGNNSVMETYFNSNIISYFIMLDIFLIKCN